MPTVLFPRNKSYFDLGYLWKRQTFLLLKDLTLFKSLSKFQKAGSILSVGFALAKWPNFHGASLVTLRKQKSIAVPTSQNNVNL